MHLPLSFTVRNEQPAAKPILQRPREGTQEDEQLMEIFSRTYGPIKRRISDRESYERRERQREQVHVNLQQRPGLSARGWL